MFLFILCCIAGISGYLFQNMNIPLAWLLGPMFSTILYIRMTKKTPKLPFSFRNIGMIPIGYMIGIQFTKDTLYEMLTHLPSMLLLTVLMMLFSVLLALLTAKLTNSNLKSTIAGSIPGGLTQMIAISSEIKGIDLTVVTVMQITRILSVVLVVPFLVYSPIFHVSRSSVHVEKITAAAFHWTIPFLLVFCFFIARMLSRWKCPAPYMIGPLLFISIFSIFQVEIPALPNLLISLAQLFIGIHLGLEIKFGNIENKPRFITVAMFSSIALVSFSLLLGLVLTAIDPNISFLTAFISLAPGGMAEMAVLGQAVQANLPIITTYQLFRLVMILFAVPFLMRIAFRMADKLRTS